MYQSLSLSTESRSEIHWLYFQTVFYVHMVKIDLLVGMDTIRAETIRYSIHKKTIAYQRKVDYDSELSHTRKSREVIQSLIRQDLSESEINENIKTTHGLFIPAMIIFDIDKKTIIAL